MRDGWLFGLGTLAVWSGLALVVLAGARGMRARLGRSRSSGSWVGPAAIGGVLIALGSAFCGGSEAGLWILPLVWPLLPPIGWFAGGAAFVAMAFLGSALWAARPRDRRAALLRAATAAGLAGAAGLITAWSGAEVGLLRGGIPLPPERAIGLGASLAAAVGAMALVGSSARARRIARPWALHLVLLSGVVVFGVPFFWMLLTSFQDERLLTGQDGLVFVPQVPVTRPLFDPSSPLFEARLPDGTRVRGAVIGEKEGRVRLDVEEPFALRGRTIEAERQAVEEVPRQVPVVRGEDRRGPYRAVLLREREDGRRVLRVLEPPEREGEELVEGPDDFVREYRPGLNWRNYAEGLDYLPPESRRGLAYLRNTATLVVLNALGTVASSALVGYAFARLRFPGKGLLFGVLLATMMLPSAVTMLPRFLIFSWLGWVDTLLPLWAPSFLAGAFSVFLLRQFFLMIPDELEDAARLDGCGPFSTLVRVMLPQVTPALAFLAVSAFIGTWNDFMGPLIYIASPERMPVSYALQQFQSDYGTSQNLLMAMATLAIAPVLVVFLLAQRFFLGEGMRVSPHWG